MICCTPMDQCQIERHLLRARLLITRSAVHRRGQRQAQAVSVRPRKGSSAICSRWYQTAPDYDQLAERRFECNYRASHIA
jgi:hypothetical protein